MPMSEAERKESHRVAQKRYYWRYPKRVRSREKARYHKHAQRERFRKSCDAAVLRGAESELTQQQWEFILEFYGNRCAYTGQSNNGVPLQLEHVLPLSQGGLHALGNVVPALPEINQRKFTKDPADFIEELGIDHEEFFERVEACSQAWRKQQQEREIEAMRASGELGAVME